MSQFKIISLCAAFLLAFAFNCEASIVDPDFEDANSSSFWSLFGSADPDFSAPGIASAQEGTQTLRLVGNGDPSGFARFSIALQDIPVDGSQIAVGYEVSAAGILGQLGNDPLLGSNRAFLEISFVDASGTEFLASIFQSAELVSTSLPDVYQSVATSVAIVPSNAVDVRVKAVFEELTVTSGENSGAAYFDNIALVVTVPEPSSGFVLAIGALAALARRGR